MKIAVIGAGTAGRALTISFKRVGREVVIADHDPESAWTWPRSSEWSPRPRRCRRHEPRTL
jgi:2-polyprenyl-6-methoxyphenol hydroxylase-like FAD-dependent oxidoreductase